jgi:hypothetical protein
LPARSRLIAGVSRTIFMEEEIQLSIKYYDYADVFLKTEADKLSESTKVAYSIEIEEGKTVSFGFIYILSANELRVLREYLNNSIAKD